VRLAPRRAIVALAASAAAYGTRVGTEGHGIWKPEAKPVCCSQAAEKNCVRTHPCREVEDSKTDPNYVHASFVRFLKDYEKEYATVEEWAHRLTVFAANLREIAEHDAAAAGYTVGLNKFSDWTKEEFAAYNKYKPRGKDAKGAPNTHVVTKVKAADAKDWRDDGLVADIKDQGQCGSCWTFSTVASIEGQHAKASGSMTTLSEQNLVDCVKDDTIAGESEECCNGCNGGLMDNAFDYIIKQQAGAIDTEASYAYEGEDDTCSFKASSSGATISNWTDVAAGDEDAMLDAVSTVGPVSVALDASKQWQTYTGGIVTPKAGFLGCSSNPGHADHGVAVVGYGTEAGTDYWIVRNSWGTSWGEDGYMRLKRGVNACGIANFVSYPNV